MVNILQLKQGFSNCIIIGLILLVGGLTPLVYVDSFSPHQGVKTYHFSLFQSAPRTLSADIIAKLSGKLTLSHQPAQIGYQRTLPPLAHSLHDSLSRGYLLFAWLPTVDKLLVFGTVTPYAMTNNPALLSPPDKPPQWLSA